MSSHGLWPCWSYRSFSRSVMTAPFCFRVSRLVTISVPPVCVPSTPHCPTLIPSFSSTSSPGALAPKRSMPIDSSAKVAPAERAGRLDGQYRHARRQQLRRGTDAPARRNGPSSAGSRHGRRHRVSGELLGGSDAHGDFAPGRERARRRDRRRRPRCRRRVSTAEPSVVTVMFWRLRINADGPSWRTTSTHAWIVSLASAGRITCRPGIARSAARCSIGWWVGPSSPTPTESWVNTKQTLAFDSDGQPDRRLHVVGEDEERAADREGRRRAWPCRPSTPPWRARGCRSGRSDHLGRWSTATWRGRAPCRCCPLRSAEPEIRPGRLS